MPAITPMPASMPDTRLTQTSQAAQASCKQRRATGLAAGLLALLLAACNDPSGSGAQADGSSGQAAGAEQPGMKIQAAALNTAGWVAVNAPNDVLLQNLAIPVDAPTRGMWSSVANWPILGVNQAVLPNGQVLTWGTPPDGGTQNGRYFDLWDPNRGLNDAGAHNLTYDPARQDSFCAPAVFAGDGRLMITGGNGDSGPQGGGGSGLRSQYYTPSNGAFAQGPSVADARWYAAMVTLSDGRSMVLGGIDPYTEGQFGNPDLAVAQGQASMTPEILENGTWRTLFNAQSRTAFGPDNLRASLPKVWTAPDGRVFGIGSDQMFYVDPNANGGSGATISMGQYKPPPGGQYDNNTAPNVGPSMSGVMFAPGKVLTVGGNAWMNGNGLWASRKATVIDINGGGAAMTEQPMMTFARNYANTIALPDGKVLVTGGEGRGNNDPAWENGANAAEQWDPATGTWTVLAKAGVFRAYHSQTSLLTNGTVLSTGGGLPGPVQLKAEVFYPPYLFRTVNGAAQLAPRPQLIGISGLKHSHGAQMQFDLSNNGAISQVALVGLSVGTHSFNSGQRRIPMAFTQDNFRITATVPNANLTPPGYYQVIAVDANGVPSRGTIVAVGANVAPPSVATTAYTPPDTGAGGTPPPPPPPGGSGTPPAAAIACAPHNGVCTLPAGITATVWYGVDTRWFSKTGVTGSIGCNDIVFGDPAVGFVKTCSYVATSGTTPPPPPPPPPPPGGSGIPPAAAIACAPHNGVCTLPAGITATVWYGVDTRWFSKTGVTGSIGCNDIVFGDPAVGFVKTCSYVATSGTTPPPTPGPITIPTINAPLIDAGGTATYTVAATTGINYSWNFGDGSPATPFANTATITKVFANAGVYGVTLTARNASGTIATRSFLQAVRTAATPGRPNASSMMALETRASASARLWVANPDNDSVSVIDTASNARVAEIAVGKGPRSVAIAGDGRVWVSNKDGASISIISPATLAVVQTVTLPTGSRPHGLAFAPGGSALVVLEGLGQLRKIDPVSLTVQANLALGPNVRHLSISGDASTALVSRFITPPLPGEGTAVVNTATAGGELLVVAQGPMTLSRTIALRHSDKIDNEIQGAGIPNYLGAAVISPDGKTAWVPSKQDNIKRGTLRNGQPLNFQNTVRAISSRIDLVNQVEDLTRRVDHDNSSLATAAAYHPSGAYLFVALETSRQLAILDAGAGRELLKVDVGLAPQGVALSADGTRVYVHNFMGRSVSVLDLGPLLNQGELRVPVLATVATVATDKLSATVLRGKQLFYDARDTRLALNSYMSCAACHSEAGHDGRTWDFTGFGEGLRNTPSLKGRAGIGQGFVHWSANFDEIQDFEGQIRSFAGGTGLMTDAQFNTGTRNTPLGDKKAGISADLDALAAYLGSLTTFDPSPNRNADGTLTAAAAAGKTVFTNANCASCHGGTGFTISGDATALKNVGTIKPASGKRLNGALAGIDVPTLRDVWQSAPYLHDGSAATLAAAVQAHQGNTVAGADLTNLVAYLQQIGSQEATAPGITPPPPPPAPNRAPTVSLTAPAINASVAQGTALTLSANAADADGTVARVEFYAGATLLSTDTTAPYSVSWTAAAPGTYSLTARAVDNLGAATTSAPVTLTVTGVAPPPPPPAQTWVRCGTQGGLCNLPGTVTVRYVNPGLNQNAQRSYSNLTFCLPVMFGLPFDAGVTGYCEYLKP